MAYLLVLRFIFLLLYNCFLSIEQFFLLLSIEQADNPLSGELYQLHIAICNTEGASNAQLY